jgi:hypothetical protein
MSRGFSVCMFQQPVKPWFRFAERETEKASHCDRDQGKIGTVSPSPDWSGGHINPPYARSTNLRITDGESAVRNEGFRMTVWIYVDTRYEIGDKRHLELFATADAADAWFAENDPEGVAFAYSVTARRGRQLRRP